MPRFSQTTPASFLFLLNDVVINLDGEGFPRRLAAKGFNALSLEAVLQMGRELYADDPLLHRSKPATARRLACLLHAKAPAINAALFIAPVAGCSPHEVTARLAETSFDIMLDLYDRQIHGGPLDTVSTDRQVWRRLAA